MKQMIYSELMTALLNIIRAEVFTIIKKICTIPNTYDGRCSEEE
jgi:hypothetical protein